MTDAVTCPACADSGEVLVDAFGHVEPWSAYVASVAEFCRERGLPEHVSSMLRPSPCPACSSQAIPSAGSAGVGGAQAPPTSDRAVEGDDGFRLAG
jgi:hypothetical protein